MPRGEPQVYEIPMPAWLVRKRIPNLGSDIPKMGTPQPRPTAKADRTTLWVCLAVAACTALLMVVILRNVHVNKWDCPYVQRSPVTGVCQ